MELQLGADGIWMGWFNSPSFHGEQVVDGVNGPKHLHSSAASIAT
jgi:hypothetical protein